MNKKQMIDQGNKSVLMLTYLYKGFYSSNENRLKVANIINKKSEYSRRTLEWFCSNYSKAKNVIYKLKNGENFNVYKSYKSKLNIYQKKQFDPFKRKRIGFAPFNFTYKDENDKKASVEITVAQLNFLKWCIENEIIEYIEKNINTIKEEMKIYFKTKEKNKIILLKK